MHSKRLTAAGLALLAGTAYAEQLGRGWWHGRYVTYTVRNGIARYQGDIVLGPASRIPREPPSGEAAKSDGSRSATFLTGLNNAYLWPDGVVPYVLDSSLTPAMLTGVRSAAALYRANTPIRWTPRTNQADYVKFAVDKSNDGSCGWSDSIGVAGGEQNIQVANDADCLKGGTFVHEMGHAIGLEHEQTRADRDYYLNIRFENIDKNSVSQYQRDPNQTDVLPYEQGSIMHYGASDYSRDNRNTIDTIPLGIPIEHRATLSAGDIEGIRTMYGTPSTTTTIHTNPAGLSVIVDGAATATPVTFNWPPGSRHTLDVPAAPQQKGPKTTRYVFARWSNDGPRNQTLVAGPASRVVGANFAEQYFLETIAGPGGTVTVDPASPDGFYAAGTSVTITPKPNTGFRFLQWDDPGGIDNSYGLSASPATLTLNFPGYSYTADFTNAAITAITTNVPGSIVTVDGTDVALPANFVWTAGSSHKLDVSTTTQDAGYTGSPWRTRFKSWSAGAGKAITATAAAGGGTIASSWVRDYLVSTYTADPLDPYGSENGTVTVNPSSTECDNPTPTDCYYPAGTLLTLSASGAGSYVFTSWSEDLSGSALPGSLRVDDQVYVTAHFIQPGRLFRSNLVNAASNAGIAISPGEVVTLTGLQLGPPDESQPGQVTGGAYATTLAQTRVLFNGVAAPLLSVQANAITAVAPYALAGRTSARVQIQYLGRAGNAINMPVTESQPALFTEDSSGSGQVTALNQDSSANSAQNPAARGSVVQVFGTGEGVTRPAVDGKVMTASAAPVLPVKVIIAGREAQVRYFGSRQDHVAGMFQADIVIPGDCQAGLVPIFVTIGDNASAATTRIAVQ